VGGKVLYSGKEFTADPVHRFTVRPLNTKTFLYRGIFNVSAIQNT